MKRRFEQMMKVAVAAMMCICLGSSSAAFAVSKNSGPKTKIQGVVVSRDGSVLKVQVKNSGAIRAVNISEKTKIKNDQKMGVNALVPGLKVKVIGMKSAEGVIEAKKIDLNTYSIAVEQQRFVLTQR